MFDSNSTMHKKIALCYLACFVHSLSVENINSMFDWICETSQQKQSMEDHSPLIALLLDATCQVDSMEQEDNPNKRWNHRVERDLGKKLFKMLDSMEQEEALCNGVGH